MRSCFSVGDRLSLIEMSFGVLDHPHLLGLLYLWLEVRSVRNAFSIEEQVVKPADLCRMVQCFRLAPLG